MPFGKCPVCGGTFHLSVGSVPEWYKERWPKLRVGDVVPELCFYCWVDLRSGHRVRVRTVPPELSDVVDVGTDGIVKSLEDGPEPVFVVYLEGAKVKEGRFRRSDLTYVADQSQNSPEPMNDKARP
jgi:hypothetical protein